MNTNQNEPSEQEHKKHVKNFTFKLVCSLVAGFVLGIIACIPNLETIYRSLPDMLTIGLQTILPFLMAIFSILLPSIGLGIFHSCTKKYREDMPEEELDRLEYDLNAPLIISSISLILSFVCMGCLMAYVPKYTQKSSTAVLPLLCAAIFIIGMVLVFVLQKKAVDFEKKLNPEKRGDVFDTNFTEVWEASCDEAEQLMIYKCTRKAYLTGKKTCNALWIICGFTSMIFDTGVFPILIVGIIWLSLQISYFRTALKQEQAMIQTKSHTPS